MSTHQLKQSIHDLIDQIEDEDFLKQYLDLLEKSTVIDADHPVHSTDTDRQMIARALASSRSIKAGKTRSLLDFKKDCLQGL